MLLTLDRWFRSIRAMHRDESGASLIVVIGLMAVGFIVAATIAASSMFAITQTTQNRQNVQAFAAAEAGRDAMVAKLSTPGFVCDVGRVYTRENELDPAFRARIFTTTLSTVTPAELQSVDPTTPAFTANWSTACPTSSTTFVRLIVEGDGPDGGTDRIDSVYTWTSYQSVVEGGALGFMDSAYTTLGVRYSGDIVVRNGNFTCATGTTIDGSVYVLDGQFRVETYLFTLPFIGAVYAGADCTINGDVVAKGGVDVPSRTTSSLLTVNGSIATSTNINAAQPIVARGDVEAKGTIAVASGGSIKTGWIQPVLKPFKQTLGEGQTAADYTYAKGDIFAEGAITASGELSTTTGAIATNASLTSSGAMVSARTGVGTRNGGINVTGSGTVRATAGSIASGTTISTASGATVSGGGIGAVQAITGSGTITATLGDVRAGAGIAAGTVSATAGSIQAMGDLVVNAATAGTTILATGMIDGGSGIVTAVGAVKAGTNITAGGGTVRSTGDAVTAVGNIATDGSNGAGTISAATNVHAGGNITTGTGTITSTGGDIMARSNISSTGAGTISTATSRPNPQSQPVITAGGNVSLKGPVIGFDIKAVGNFDASGACTLHGSVRAAGTVNLRVLAKAADNANPAPTRCIIRGHLLSWSGTSTLPEPRANTNASTTRPQIWVAETVQAPTWQNNSRFRLLPKPSYAPASTVADTAPQARVPTGTGVGAAPVAADRPAIPSAPTGLTTPVQPEAYAFIAPNYPNLHVRTGWIDLGTHITDWGSAFTERYQLNTGECSDAVNVIRNRIQQAGTSGIVIDAATNCRTTTIDLRGWASLNLHRDAIILVHNVDIRLIRFSQTGGVVRQLFIVQVDDNLRTARPAYDVTAPPEPQPDCEGREKIDTFGAQWTQNWDPLVRVMLYSPCGTEWLGGGTGLFSSWSGRQYVANNGAHRDIIAKIDCYPMTIPGKLDLPCHIDTIGLEGGQQLITGKRMGTRIYQTEP